MGVCHSDPRVVVLNTSERQCVRNSAVCLQSFARERAEEEAGRSPSDECSRREEIIGTDESSLGCKTRGESIVESLSVSVRRLVYSRLPSLGRKPFETRGRSGERFPRMIRGIPRE